MAFPVLIRGLLIVVLLAVPLIGAGPACTNLFLQPSRDRYPFAKAAGLAPEELSITSLDGAKLSAWLFASVDCQKRRPDLVVDKVDKAKALIVQFHGNAENMTSHYRFLEWAPFQGYDLLTFDYRGYGASEGVANARGANLDARAALRFAGRMAEERGLPLVLYGQSLGGTLMLRALEDDAPGPQALRLIAVESSFYGYREIAREKMEAGWLTRPLAWLAYPLVSDRWTPGGPRLRSLPRVPIVMIYSAQDPIVPINHGFELFAQMNEPKQFWAHGVPGHVNGMFVEDGRLRQKLAAMIDGIAKGDQPPLKAK